MWSIWEISVESLSTWLDSLVDEHAWCFKTGVPQGSVPIPLLFTLNIDDITNTSDTKTFILTLTSSRFVGSLRLLTCPKQYISSTLTFRPFLNWNTDVDLTWGTTHSVQPTGWGPPGPGGRADCVSRTRGSPLGGRTSPQRRAERRPPSESWAAAPPPRASVS